MRRYLPSTALADLALRPTQDLPERVGSRPDSMMMRSSLPPPPPGDWARLVNQVSVDTRWGMRRFELFEGDLTQHPVSDRADVLTLSVFPGRYDPKPGSMLASLRARFGIDVAALRLASEVDATGAFGCWLSAELPAGLPFRRVLVNETLGEQGRNIGDVLIDIFAFATALEAKGIRVETVVMPLMGAGAQGIAPQSVIEPLLRHSLDFLERARTARHVRFVERDETRVRELSSAMDRQLGRVAVGLPADSHAAMLCKDMATFAEAHAARLPRHANVLRELATLVREPDDVTAHVFAVSRRIAEAVVSDLHEREHKRAAEVLWKSIDGLSSLGYAPWLCTYLHTLRIFGNETVHDRSQRAVRPAHLGQADLEVCLVVLSRVLKMWLAELDHEPSA